MKQWPSNTPSQENPENKIKKYIYAWLVWLRAILGVHVFYVYASAEWDGSKWGTFVEATTDQINFLPYTSTNDINKLYKNFLFEWCAKPVFSGTNIWYENVLCEINTDDYKVFTASVPPNNFWSDGEPLTIEDVFFTYSSLLKNNTWNLEQFSNYKNINIQVDGTQLIVSFPNASIDNMIFFTNFVLPEHILANQTFEFYTSVFAQNPISSGCAVLQTWENDSNSAIFDLWACEESSIKFYQVKYFPNTSDLVSYTNTDASNIDIVLTANQLEWFTPQQYISNKFSVVFVNTEKNRSNTLRSNLVSIINKALEWHPLLIEDNFLFDNISQDVVVADIPTLIQEQNNPVQAPEIEEENDDLPASIQLWSQDDKVYSIDEVISSRKVLNLSFDTAYDQVSVIHNNGGEYFPKSYSKTKKSASYNISPVLRNIATGENIYSINAYIDNERVDSFEVRVSYLTPTQQDIPEAQAPTDSEPDDQDILELIYFEDTINTSIVKNLDAYLNSNNLWGLINFVWYTDNDELEGKIESGEYDLALRTINMWLRKDLSNIFISESAYINPSKYVDEELAWFVSEYFRASYDRQQIIKTSIDRIYAKSYPLVILGKQLETYQINKNIEKSPFPERMYVFGWRKDYVPNIEWFGHVTIDRDKLLNRNNFANFIKEL